LRIAKVKQTTTNGIDSTLYLFVKALHGDLPEFCLFSTFGRYKIPDTLAPRFYVCPGSFH
ncbi:MAG: hypothetical protein MZV70_43240, partial [Desulfobacterales bacterium]|nr:hypothetical protein [Desulfobacterales bacterium]